MRFTTFFFDLDETLYPPDTGLWEAIAERITRYMVERLRFPPEQVVALREEYFRNYGTTLRGLQANYAIDSEDYLAFVHDVPLERYLRPDPELRRILDGLPGRKFIFTNADHRHANRVLKARGLEGAFDGIIDVHTIAPYCKPMSEAFHRALQAAGEPPPRQCMLLDDQPRVTRAGRSLGLYTVLVGKQTAEEEADAVLSDLLDLPRLLERC